MNQEQDTLWMIKGVIGDLPEDRRHKIVESYNKLKTIVAEYEDDAIIAIALLGAELSVKMAVKE